MAKQWQDTPYAQYYTQTEWPDARSDEEIKAAVLKGVETISQQMYGDHVPLDQDTSASFNRWLYFQHLSKDAILQGWYSKLEAQQGTDRTFYVGGATSFELVESIAEYSKNLVKTHFPIIPTGKTIALKTVLKFVLGLFIVSGLAYCAFAPPPLKTDYTYQLGVRDDQGVGREFWDIFQQSDTRAIAPAPCEASSTTADIGPTASIVCRLTAISDANPDDNEIAELASGLYLWRAQTGLFPDVLESDLEQAAFFGRRAAQQGNQFAPGFLASALWSLALVKNDDALGAEAVALFELDTARWPGFHGFIEAQHISAGLNAGESRFGVRYDRSLDSMGHMLAGCLLGKLTPEWMRLPPDMKIHRFVLNALYLITLVNGQKQCYDNDPAPYGLPGTYIVIGDIYLKQGDYIRAAESYSNANLVTSFAQWPFRRLVDDRIGNLAEHEQRFILDSGQFVSNSPLAMIGQSPVYCAMCHGNAGSGQ